MKTKTNQPATSTGLEILKAVPRGKPKSGRPWKPNRDRFSTMTIGQPCRSSWAAKMKMRNDRKSVQNYEKELKQQRAQDKLIKRQRTEENARRKLVNERKSEIVQPIKNTAKIKRMKKKQLRMIQKR